MAAVVLADNAYGTLGVSITSTDSSITLTTGHGARFPLVSNAGLYCCLINSGNVLEEIRITSHAANADTAVVQRAQGGTTAKVWSAGDRVEARLSSSALNALFQAVPLSPYAKNAVGDGVTDDTAAVVAALADGDVYLPSGAIFLVTATVAAASKRRVFGPGKLRIGANGISALQLTVAGSSVEGISVDNPGGFVNSGGTRCIGIDVEASQCTVSGCKVDGVVNAIVSGLSQSANTIVGNVVTNALGVASETHGDGIAVFGPNCTVSGNTVSCKAGTDGRCGIVFDLAAQYGTCFGNTVTGPFRRTIHVELSPYTVVLGNTLRGATQWGLIVSTNDFCSVIGNVVDTPTTPTSGLGDCQGIYVFNANNTKVSGNTVVGAGAKVGIYCAGNRCVIEGNHVTGSANSLVLYGIFISNRTDCTVSNNVVDSGVVAAGVGSGFGIYCFQAVRSRVIGNSTTGCGGNGIQVAASDNTIVSGNTSRNNTDVGITVSNSGNCSITSNRCYDDGTGTQLYGINVFNGDYSVIAVNALHGNATAGTLITGTTVGQVVANNVT